MSDKNQTTQRSSTLDNFNQALIYRAAEQVSLAIRTGKTFAEFRAMAGGEALTFVASLNADPVSTMFCICVHEKASGRFVCRSDEMALDTLRLEAFEPFVWFDACLDPVEDKPAPGRGE
jgi:hypothetical protein